MEGSACLATREQKYIPGDRVFEGELLARHRTGWFGENVEEWFYVMEILLARE
jgi:hypothetical protein